MTDLKCRLLERRSKSTGATYLSGRLGDARVIAFRETGTPADQLFGADAMWTIYVASGDQGYEARTERRERVPLAAARPFRREDR
jgi:hypothetical protein